MFVIAFIDHSSTYKATRQKS